MLWKQCDEDVVAVMVGSSVGGGWAPVGIPLSMEEGRAQILVAAQIGPNFRIDGVELGATTEEHYWVASEAPAMSPVSSQPRRSSPQ